MPRQPARDEAPTALLHRTHSPTSRAGRARRDAVHMVANGVMEGCRGSARPARPPVAARRRSPPPPAACASACASAAGLRALRSRCGPLQAFPHPGHCICALCIIKQPVCVVPSGPAALCLAAHARTLQRNLRDLQPFPPCHPTTASAPGPRCPVMYRLQLACTECPPVYPAWLCARPLPPKRRRLRRHLACSADPRWSSGRPRCTMFPHVAASLARWMQHPAAPARLVPALAARAANAAAAAGAAACRRFRHARRRVPHLLLLLLLLPV